MNCLKFTIKSQVYAINIDDVDEVLMMASIKPIIGAPDFMQGVLQLHGDLVPVVDLMQQLGIHREVHHQDETLSQFTTDTRLLITHINKQHKVAILVDGWSGLLTLEEDAIQTAVVDEKGLPNFISDIARYEDELLQLVAIKQVLTNEQLALLKVAA